MALTARLLSFIDNLVSLDPHTKKEMSISEAYIRAGFSAATAHQASHKAYQRPDVQEEIAKRRAARAVNAEIGVKEVLAHWEMVAMADPTELVEHRLGACRHCWGEGFKPMFTPAEFERMKSAHEQSEKDRRASAIKKNEAFDPHPFDERGGIGFNPNKGPNPDCPECFGDGTTRPIFKDTRNLSVSAKSLYAGLKVKKDGMELILADQKAAWDNIAKHRGMFVERTMVVEPDLSALTPEQIMALRDIQEILARGQS